MAEAWQAVARYSVYRSEYDGCKGAKRKTLLHSNLTHQQALVMQAQEDQALRKEPGYRPYVMSRPLITIELEKSLETKVAYVERRRQSAAGPATPLTRGLCPET